MTTEHYHSARTEAETGIERADRAIRAAQEKHSPLAPYLTRYVAQRAAYALTAARMNAIIERLEQGYGT